MKTKYLLLLMVFFVILTSTLNTSAQDYTQWELPEGAKARLGKGEIYDIQYSPDGTRLAVASSIGIWVYDAQTGKDLDLLTGHTWSVNSVSFSPDGKTIASGSFDETVRLWDANTGRHLRTFTGHTGDVYSVSFSPDSSTLASGSGDDTVFLWEVTPTSSEPERIAEDVNGDGVVNIIDLTLVASNFGKTGENAADVNGDGVVNIIDLTLVAAAFGNTASAAPEIWSCPLDGTLTRAEVEAWLREARQMNLTDASFQRGILILEQLLVALTPKETVLLPNYPNPFNPETWIPYQLATSADVTLTIYSANGVVVRTIQLGNIPAGIYQNKNRAAYWDGKNELGEPVASGVYFYTLTAGEFTATRKMLIRK